MRLVNKSAILCFMFSLTAGAQTANLGLSQTKSVFAKMSAEKAADHALRSKAGQCTATRLPGASNVYTLRWNEGSKRRVERFGRILPQMFPRSEIFFEQAPQQVNYKQSEIEKFFKELKNNLLIANSYAFTFSTIKPPMYVMPLHTMDFIKSAKTQLGSRVKALIALDKCGNVIFESFSQSMTSMKNNVTFYKDGEKIRCESKGFALNIRNPDNCTTTIVKTELPAKACNSLYRQISQVQGRNAIQSSTTPTPATGVTGATGGIKPLPVRPHYVNTAVLPMFEPFTEEIRKDFELSHVLTEKPDLIEIADSAVIPDADHVLPATLLDMIEAKPINAASFDALSVSEKTELLHLHYTHEAIKADSAYIKFSPDLASITSDIRPKLLAFEAANPNILPQIHAIPKHVAIREYLDLELQPIRAIRPRPWLYNLGCMYEMVRYERPAEGTNMWE
jgi:hypothetical protein